MSQETISERIVEQIVDVPMIDIFEPVVCFMSETLTESGEVERMIPLFQLVPPTVRGDAMERVRARLLHTWASAIGTFASIV